MPVREAATSGVTEYPAPAAVAQRGTHFISAAYQFVKASRWPKEATEPDRAWMETETKGHEQILSGAFRAFGLGSRNRGVAAPI